MKNSTLQLAAFGGSPVFRRPLHVGQPNQTSHEQLLSDLHDVLRSGCLTNHGPRVKAFEAAVCRVSGTRNCVAVCNATTALQIAARAMGLTGEVILPAFTFIATAHAMEWIGLTPVFADVDESTHTLNPASTEACISPRTSAIVPVHLWGNVCSITALSKLAEKHSLRLLFDSSHAFGCRQSGVAVGNFGDAEVFSFHATKLVHSIEGGAILTNNDELAERCRRLRAFGITGLSEVSDVGINGKMHEMSAAVGLRSLEALPKILAASQRNRSLYELCLRDVDGIRLLATPDDLDGNWQYIVAEVDEERFGLSRDLLVSVLRCEGIFARSYFSPGCHRSAPYADQPTGRHVRVPLTVTERLLRTVMQFPTGLSIGAEDILRIGSLVRFIQQNSSEIRRQHSLRFGQLSYHDADPARPRDSALREAG